MLSSSPLSGTRSLHASGRQVAQLGSPFGRPLQQPPVLSQAQVRVRRRGQGTVSGGPRHAACTAAREFTPIASAQGVASQSSPGMTLASGVMRRAELTALASMAHVPASIRKLVHTYMPAPCVSRQIMALSRALFELTFPIVTRLRYTAWHDTLLSLNLLHRYSDIPLGLEHGFLMGLENFSLVNTVTPPNHFKLPEHALFIRTKYQEEITLGRISAGYERTELHRLIGHFRTAPLNVVQHTPGGKMRVTVDHSFPRSASAVVLGPTSSHNADFVPFDPASHSVNAIIDSRKFQCTWGTFAQCYLLVADAPAGTEAAVFDVDAAFRNVPTHPSVRPFLAVMIDDKVHLDHCLNFGASPCPGIWGRIADAMVEIYKAKGVDAVIKWVDDFVFFRYRQKEEREGRQFTYDESRLWDVAEQLGWPWAPKKCSPFASSFIYIGFHWDLGAKTVCLPAAKKEKYLGKLECWTAVFKPTCTEVESLIGTLNHVTMVVPAGRARLLHLYKLRATFNQSRHRWVRHSLNEALLADISWWRVKFSENFVGMKVIRPPAPSADRIFVDASTGWGIGLLVNDRWLAWRLCPGWHSDGRDIGWAEMTAVELAIRALIADGHRDKHVVIHSDNQGVVGSMRAGHSRGCQQNAILRHIVSLMQDSGIWVSTNWISTHANPADALSRGLLPSHQKRMSARPPLPSHLSTLLTVV